MVRKFHLFQLFLYKIDTIYLFRTFVTYICREGTKLTLLCTVTPLLHCIFLEIFKNGETSRAVTEDGYMESMSRIEIAC